MSNEHKKVAVRDREQVIMLDAAIAPLIEQVWKAGITTTSSCQENPKGRCWIRFTTPADAQSFVNIVMKYVPDDDPVYRRILALTRTPKDWKYALEPAESIEKWTVVAADQLNWKPPARVSFSVAVSFPDDELPVLTALLMDYNG